MIKTFNLSDKIVIITGGYGYLGKAIVENLVFHGAKVYVLGRSREKFDTAFQSHIDFNTNIVFLHGDIEITKSIKQAFQSVFTQERKINVLINNAFYSRGQSPEEMIDEDWSYGIDGTLNSIFRSTREIIPFLKKSLSGKIINVSSMYGIVAPHFDVYNDHSQFLNPPHYGAAKAGVIQLTKYYAAYLGKNFNIQVNCVTPGPFPSEIVQKEKKFIEKLSEKTCLNRIGFPEDLAGAFTFLSSEASDYITGQNIIVDGGWTAK